MNTDERYISRLQESLPIIRKVAGWSAEDLGSKIGVSKQTISNIERQNTKLTLTQYIAIRSVIDYEIKSNNNDELAEMVLLLLERDDSELSEEDIRKNQECMKLISQAAAGGQMQNKELSFALKSLIVGASVAATAVASYVAGVVSSDWLKKVLNNK